MYKELTLEGKNPVIIADAKGIYDDKHRTIPGTLRDVKVGRLYYWCNSIGEINIPGRNPDDCATLEELPADAANLYERYQQEDDGMHLYTVNLNGVNGMLFTMLCDVEWVKGTLKLDMDDAFELVCQTVVRVSNEKTLPKECTLLALKGTNPDGHELGVFFPADACGYIPAFDEAKFSDSIYASMEVMAEENALDGDYDAETVQIWLDTMFEDAIREVEMSISNERLWELAYTGKNPNPHTHNIENLKAYRAILKKVARETKI